MADTKTVFYGTGRRKRSIARVRLVEGNGTITVNGKDLNDYFGAETLKYIVRQPLSVTETSSNNYRLRRIIESNDFFKDVMYKFFLLRENSLVLDQSKSYYSDKDPHYSIICSEYYVFALRRILI